MKKFLVFFVIIIVIVSIIAVQYSSYKVEQDTIKQENAEFEQYKNKEIYGLDLATIINKVMDKNIKNEIPKDNQNIFIENETNSIKMEIYMTDNEETYRAEIFYNNGIDQFMEFYSDIKFKCSKIEYHEKTGKIKYLYFEQIPIS